MASLPCAALLFTVVCSFFLEVAQGQNRLYDGYDVPIKQYSFVVAIAYGPDLVGNGAILSDFWVISAASTFSQRPDEHYVVRAGGDSFEETYRYPTKRVYRHPAFKRWDNNVALLKTAEQLVFGPTVMPVQIAPEDPGKAYSMMISYGDNENGHHHLRAGVFLLDSNTNCAHDFKDRQAKQVIKKGHGYCLYSRPKTAQGHAHNDAGAPIVVHYGLYGIFAGSEFAETRSKVSMATRLSAYTEWIEATMR